MVPVVQANGLEIFYAESGRGPPILWLQGLGAEHTAWSAQLARFGAQYRCIAPDSRDVGRSARVSGSYTLAETTSTTTQSTSFGQNGSAVDTGTASDTDTTHLYVTGNEIDGKSQGDGWGVTSGKDTAIHINGPT